MKTEKPTAPAKLTAADLVKNCGVPADRADAVLEVMTKRSVSPTRAIELLDSAAWHKSVEDGRLAASKPLVAPKPGEGGSEDGAAAPDAQA